MSKPESPLESLKSLAEPAGALADDVIDFFETERMPLTSWQQEVLRRVFALNPDGKVAEPNVRLSAASEAGLNTALAYVVIAWLFLLREPLILWSASSRDAEREAFEEVMGIISSSTLLSGKVQRVNRASGDRELRLLPHGSRLRLTYPRLLVRSRHSGRGVSASRLIISQAGDFSDGDAGMLLPVLAAVPDPQVLWCRVE